MPTQKILLIPFYEGRIFIQDRTNHRDPHWGYIGGEIQPMAEDKMNNEELKMKKVNSNSPEVSNSSETNKKEAAVKYAMDELTLYLDADDLVELGEFKAENEERTVFMWNRNIVNAGYYLQEGKDMKLVKKDEAKELLSDKTDLEILEKAFDKLNELGSVDTLEEITEKDSSS